MVVQPLSLTLSIQPSPPQQQDVYTRGHRSVCRMLLVSVN